MSKIKLIKEPNLIFGFNQQTIDPRDGLALFGPYEKLGPYSMRAGIVGCGTYVENYEAFVKDINRPIISSQTKYNEKKFLERKRPSFPGFEAVFGIKWPAKPEAIINVNERLIDINLNQKNKAVRTSALVDLYLDPILKFLKKEDSKLDIWFIIIPHKIYKACRPQSWGSDLSKGTKDFIKHKKQGQLSIGFLDEESYEENLAKILDTPSDFHHLLKARLIQEGVKIPVQLMIDRGLNFRDKNTNKKYDEYLRANFAWTLSTTIYYKLGKLPWKLGDIREGVCYIGLVFKKLPNNEKNNVCSAAQMFLRDGDGSVFRGNIGLWESAKPYEFHLTKDSAESLIGMALDDYFEKWGRYPKELFIHSKTSFDDSEWDGFASAVHQRGAFTNLVGILIKDLNELKLYRQPTNQKGSYGVLRGTALIVDDKEGYLCTKGFIPRLNSSNAMGMPRNLRVKVIRGEADIEIVLEDILALTKLNYNSCIYGDGVPVTLKFSNKIGSILTATPNWQVDTRQFMYYI